MFLIYLRFQKIKKTNKPNSIANELYSLTQEICKNIPDSLWRNTKPNKKLKRLIQDAIKKMDLSFFKQIPRLKNVLFDVHQTEILSLLGNIYI